MINKDKIYNIKYPAIIVEVADSVEKAEGMPELDKNDDISSENKYRLYIKTGRLNYVGNICYTESNIDILLEIFKGSNIYLMEDESNGYMVNKDVILSAARPKL